MTNEFAIKDLKGLAMFEHRVEFIHTMDVEAINLAIDALEKRIPKRILYNTGNWAYQCPTCRSIYEDDVYPKDYYNFCPCCGQALDWMEVDDV